MTEHRKIPGYLHHSVLRAAVDLILGRDDWSSFCDKLAADERRASECASDTALSAEELTELRDCALPHVNPRHLRALIDGYDITGETARLRGQLANAERTVKELREEIAAVRRVLPQETNREIRRADDAERERDELRAQLADAQVVLRAHEAEEEKLRGELQDARDSYTGALVRVDALRAEVEALRSRLAKAEDVVTVARRLDAYDWTCRLDDSKASDDAKHDARELGIAVWHYDQALKGGEP